MFQDFFSFLLMGYSQTECLATPLDGDITRLCPSDAGLEAFALAAVAFFVAIVYVAVTMFVAEIKAFNEDPKKRRDDDHGGPFFPPF